jgi:hypothetical protein
MVDATRQHMTEVIEPYTDRYTEALLHHADPHPKKALREQCWKEMSECGLFHADVWMNEAQKVWVKFKNDEWMKPGKIPRVIGDLGVAASLQGFRICEFLKSAMAKSTIMLGSVTTEFVKKPDHDVLKRVFDNLIHPPEGGYYAYFSDDSCFSIRIGDRVRMFNLDIASCDSSHGNGAFATLIALTPEPLQAEMIDLLEQCSRSFQIRNPEDPRMKITIKIKGKERYVLYSGSVITTLINNVANIMIAAAISMRKITCGQDIMDAAAEAGYVITGCSEDEECELPEDLQFLKHSPCLNDDNEYVPILNVGVLLRTTGHAKGDIPGKRTVPLIDRARSFQKSLLQGMYPRTISPLIDSMKHAVASATIYNHNEETTAKTLAFKVTTTELNRITTSDLMRRYRLTAEEEHWMEHYFPTVGYGEIASHSALDKILEKDYGITTTTDFRQSVLDDYHAFDELVA